MNSERIPTDNTVKPYDFLTDFLSMSSSVEAEISVLSHCQHLTCLYT